MTYIAHTKKNAENKFNVQPINDKKKGLQQS